MTERTRPGPAFVAGATGYVGRALVRRLAAAGGDVAAHVRPGSAVATDAVALFESLRARVDRTPWDVAALRATLGSLAPATIFITLGTTRRRSARARARGEQAGYEAIDRDLPLMLVKACLRAGIRPKLVYLSAIGADPGARGAYLRARGEVERRLRASSLPWVVARPAFVTGPDRPESRPLERIAAALVDGILAGVSALGWRGPGERFGSLDADAMAAALDALASDPAAEGTVVEGAALRRAAGAAGAAR